MKGNSSVCLFFIFPAALKHGGKGKVISLCTRKIPLDFATKSEVKQTKVP